MVSFTNSVTAESAGKARECLVIARVCEDLFEFVSGHPAPDMFGAA